MKKYHYVVPLLNLENGSGVLLLNFEEGQGHRPRVPRSQVLGPVFTPWAKQLQPHIPFSVYFLQPHGQK